MRFSRYGRRRMDARVLLLLAGVLVLALAGVAEARPAGTGRDGRPNILVVMTDDQAAADVAQMPNVKRLLARRGTAFADAIDSFPLCCPARATFITGQYAHNHGVAGNFYPYGWYGMKGRGNTLPRWLQKAGYRTALVGKWLNGYGAKDAHGEVPKGFDIWRGLLDVSAYDYYNFVMNLDGRLKAWGDSDFAHKLVRFASVEVSPNPGGLTGVLNHLTDTFGPGPYHYWGAENPQDYSPAGPDPRYPQRYAPETANWLLPKPPSFAQQDLSKEPSNIRDNTAPLSQNAIDQLQLDYQGRIGGLRAVDDHVAKLVQILRTTHQLDNTLIVFVSDNGWLQGQHDIPGDKYLPYEESIRVPFILRGPGVPAGETVRGQVTNVDFASTLLDAAGARAGRTQDGVSLLPTARDPRRRPRRTLEIEATAPLFEGDVPTTAGTSPMPACAPTATRTSSTRRPGKSSSTTARPTRTN
jgi:N-acetylglucosamine-6-sulfatase